MPADCRSGLTAPPSGVLPVNQPQMTSLFKALRHAPDPRYTQYRTAAVLALMAMALLAGRREIEEIALFATP